MSNIVEEETELEKKDIELVGHLKNAEILEKEKNAKLL